MSDEKPWLNGKPYYCDFCGSGGGEVMACEDVRCKMESEADAQARKLRHMSAARVERRLCKRCRAKRLGEGAVSHGC